MPVCSRQGKGRQTDRKQGPAKHGALKPSWEGMPVHLLCPLPGTSSPSREMLLELAQRNILRCVSPLWVCGPDVPEENEVFLCKRSSAGLVCACIQAVPFRNGAEQRYPWFIAGCPSCYQTCWLHQQALSSQPCELGGN